MSYGTKHPGGLKWDAGRTPPKNAVTAIPCGSIVQLAAGKNWFGIAGQAITAGQTYSLSREGYHEVTVPADLVLADGDIVYVTPGTGGVCSVAAYDATDAPYKLGRCVGGSAAGSATALIELLDFEDPADQGTSST